MKRKTLKVIILVVLCLSTNSPASGMALEVVNSFPSPASIPRGLTWDGEYLWHSGGPIYKLDTLGNVVNQYNWPYSESYGMAFDGENVWIVDNSSDYVYEYSTDWELLSSFPIPDLNGNSLHGVGLAWDGANLWLSTGYFNADNYLLKVTTSGEILESFHPLDEQLADLAWDGISLWATSTYNHKIYQINTNGEVLQTFDLGDQNPNGITYDGDCLWYVDREPNKMIYQVQVVSGSTTSSTSTTTIIETSTTTTISSTSTTTTTIIPGAFSQTIGDDDNFGCASDPPSSECITRSTAEQNATNGAQYTDWYVTDYQRRFIFDFGMPITNIEDAYIDVNAYDLEDDDSEFGYPPDHVDIQINIEGYDVPEAFDDVVLRFTSGIINYDLLDLLGANALEDICSDGIVTVDFLNAGSYQESYAIDWVSLSIEVLSDSTTTTPTITTSIGGCTYGSCITTGECTAAYGTGWACINGCCENTGVDCPISIAIEGDETQLDAIRAFRDTVLNQTPEGQEIIKLYYQWSPFIVKAMEEDEDLKEQMKEIIDGVLGLVGE